mmetsp:Transcript_64438/g.140322  ORF Transcript_64438/g.140322 Transcript_64438/m.140322 type:complete len:207 (+) Transcript_64438:1455-2075(+)
MQQILTIAFVAALSGLTLHAVVDKTEHNARERDEESESHRGRCRYGAGGGEREREGGATQCDGACVPIDHHVGGEVCGRLHARRRGCGGINVDDRSHTVVRHHLIALQHLKHPCSVRKLGYHIALCVGLYAGEATPPRLTQRQHRVGPVPKDKGARGGGGGEADEGGEGAGHEGRGQRDDVGVNTALCVVTLRGRGEVDPTRMAGA